MGILIALMLVFLISGNIVYGSQNFRSYVINSIAGSTGRQHFYNNPLKLFTALKITNKQMIDLHSKSSVLFNKVRQVLEETKILLSLLDIPLSKLTKTDITA